MNKLMNLETNRVFHYFEELSNIPRGSGNMKKVADYCVEFAENHNLKYNRDSADNVIIYKSASKGYENLEPIILQGHLDMVCQKREDKEKDFLNEGISILSDGDFICADSTTLGADNGIAVAMVLSILESVEIAHPPIEAVFTTDEEIGMIGASLLDFSLLKGKRMINLDSEDENVLTVSCAGGSDFKAKLPINYTEYNGTKIVINISGLKGGHSGVEIHKGRVNAAILTGRILNYLSDSLEFSLISVNSGNKPNVISNLSQIELCVKHIDEFCAKLKNYLNIVATEIKERESNFSYEISVGETGNFLVFDNKTLNNLIYILTCTPDGVQQMSAEIENLVETSLNLGILKTEEKEILFHHALRSNKSSALSFLEKKIERFYSATKAETETFGHYPPWEFKENSYLKKLYKKAYSEQFGSDVKVEAIHAGLECGVFAANIQDFDCISIGPQLFDVHTVNERLSISSTGRIYKLLLKILAELN